MILRIVCTKTYYILSSQCNHYPVCSICAKGIMHVCGCNCVYMHTCVCVCACVMFVTKITSVYTYLLSLVKYLCEKGRVYNHSLIIVTIIIYRCLIWSLIPQLLNGYNYIGSQCHIIYDILWHLHNHCIYMCMHMAALVLLLCSAHLQL